MDEKTKQGLITKAIAFSITLGLIISILVVWGVGIQDVLDHFREASWLLILGYILVSLMVAVAITAKWAVALDAYGVRLPFYTLFIYRLIGFSVSYVTPAMHVGGEPVRALLVGRQGIPYKVSFSAVIVDKMLEMLFNFTMFFLGALVILNVAGFPLIARASIFVLSAVLVAALAILLYNVLKKQKVFVPILRFFRVDRRKDWKRIKKSVNEVEILIEHFYAHRNKHFLASLSLNAILWCLMFLEYKLALLILGYDAGLFGIFLFLTGVGIAYSIPIPAALGVLELGQVSAGALLGIKSSFGVALAFLVRLRDICWTIIGLALLGLFHLNLFRLYERSVGAAKKYNFDTLHPELRNLYENVYEEMRR